MTTAACTDPECFINQQAGEISAATATGLIIELERLIRRCLEHGVCYFVIDARKTHRYVQGLTNRFGAFLVESVSNESLGAECRRAHGLTDADHGRLARLGWLPPGKASPNWHRTIDPTWSAPSPLVAELLVRTLVEVHRAAPSGLTVTLGHAQTETPRRPVEDSDAA